MKCTECKKEIPREFYRLAPRMVTVKKNRKKRRAVIAVYDLEHLVCRLCETHKIDTEVENRIRKEAPLVSKKATNLWDAQIKEYFPNSSK